MDRADAEIGQAGGAADGVAPESAEEVQRAAERLEGRPPLEVLGWAAGRFAPRLTLATGFGVEGCVLIDIVARHRLPVDVFTLDTGLLFPETYALWRRIEARYGLAIRAVKPALSVERQAVLHGERLWQGAPDRCCAIRKVEPLVQALRGFDAWITAIRREQTPDRAVVRVVERDPRSGLVKVNPLAGWTTDDVWSYVRSHDVPVNPLHAQGYPSIGCWPCTSPVLPGEGERAGRWRGSAKLECGLHSRPAARVLSLQLQRP